MELDREFCFSPITQNYVLVIIVIHRWNQFEEKQNKSKFMNPSDLLVEKSHREC